VAGACRIFFVAAVAAVLAATASATTGPGAISKDTYTNASSQHRTQVEPDSYAHGSTIVAAFQTGRFFDGGASNVGWATSQDGGRSWRRGVLPGTTVFEGGTYARVSDPAVAYDARHGVWMISTLGIDSAVTGDAVLTSRSTDGGLTWQPPVTVSVSPNTFYDKNWIACDNWPSSPYFGNCYTEWDDNGLGNRLLMSTSTDGGLTWGPALAPSGFPSGLGGQPVAQPDGTVVVPYTANYGSIRAFTSENGGASWSGAVTVTSQSTHNVAGGLRDPPLPSAEVDQSGRVYVVWHDCRFRSGCASNDIVMSTYTDLGGWAPVVRIPIDPVTSTVDHFLPGIGVETVGDPPHLALTYYYYPVSNCGGSCALTVGFISSLDGGASWSAPTQLGPPMQLSWIASTSQGRMVGDYVSTSFSEGKAHAVYSWANPPAGSVFDQATLSAAMNVTGPADAVAVKREKVRVRGQPLFSPWRSRTRPTLR
jgi:hypothetical protein